MYRVYLTNHSRYLDDEFLTLASAIEAGKATGFEFSIYGTRSDLRWFSWSPLYGVTFSLFRSAAK